MIFKPEEKLLIIERRTFQEDIQRHFIGVLVAATDHNIRIIGHPWVYNFKLGMYERRPEQRERVFHLSERQVIIVLPPEADLEAVRYSINAGRQAYVTGGQTFSLEITEFVSLG